MIARGDRKRAILVGGCGFVGVHLARRLVSDGYLVLIWDVAPFPQSLLSLQPTLTYQKMDIVHVDAEQLKRCLNSFNPDLVVSIAGWGMSTYDMLSSKCWDVNYKGTCKLVEACKQCGISRFIFTSTYNVVFHGQTILKGDETMKYANELDHVDEYSRSKTRAEAFVLEQNGTELSSGKSFLTSVIRPGAIYGDDEQRHIPRIVRLMDLGVFSLCSFGSALVDWLHVENLVEAYVALASRLLDPQRCAAVAGQAYFISDDEPITNVEFLSPLCKARHRLPPICTLPTPILYAMASMCETMHRWKLPTLKLFTRAEVCKMGVTHVFPPKKACAHLDYSPKITSRAGAQRLAQLYTIPVNTIEQREFWSSPPWYTWLGVGVGMGLLYTVAYEHTPWSLLGYLCPSKPDMHQHVFLSQVKTLSYFMYSYQSVMQWIWIWAVSMHVGESIYAGIYAKLYCYMNAKSTFWWTLQTLCLGYPSLSLLQEHYRARVQPMLEAQFAAIARGETTSTSNGNNGSKGGKTSNGNGKRNGSSNGHSK